MKNDLKDKRLFYARFIASIGLYCVFIIGSVMELLTRPTTPPSLLLGGLLIAAVLVLPRSVGGRRRVSGAPGQAKTPELLERMQLALTVVRVVYLAGAIFVWLALPSLI